MNKEQVVLQLQELIADRNSFIDPNDDTESNIIYEKDIKALNEAISYIRNDKLDNLKRKIEHDMKILIDTIDTYKTVKLDNFICSNYSEEEANIRYTVYKELLTELESEEND